MEVSFPRAWVPVLALELAWALVPVVTQAFFETGVVALPAQICVVTKLALAHVFFLAAGRLLLAVNSFLACLHEEGEPGVEACSVRKIFDFIGAEWGKSGSVRSPAVGALELVENQSVRCCWVFC